MNHFTLFLLVAVATNFAAGTVRADEKKSAEQGSLGKAIVDRFDANGNGRIDPDEAAAAREQLANRGGKGAGLAGKGKDGKRREALLKKFDANGNGKLDGDEIQAAKTALEKMRAESGKGKGKEDGAKREALLKKFDANGNGQLDPDEKKAAKAELQKRREGKISQK